MQEHWTVSEYKNYKEKKSKYKNKKVIIDGIEFDSQKEGNHYLELKMLERQGLIRDIGLQTRFELLPSYKKNGKTIRGIYYFADFTYYQDNKLIVEDTKGFRTEVYKLKKKLFEYKFPDLQIKEV